MRILRTLIAFPFIVIAALAVVAVPVLALNIDGTDKYAWGENIGWINFGTTEGDVDVSATAMDGYAWGENVGWISLSCSNTSSCLGVNYGVTVNSGTGALSGYAWGENIGWINFNPTYGGVTINTSTGEFSGYAWGENIGWISFNCSDTTSCGVVDYKVKTSFAFTTPTATPTPDVITGGGGSTPGPSVPPGSPTPVPSGSVTPLPSGSVTPLPSGSVTPLPSGSVTPLPSGSETPPPPTGSPIPTPTTFPTPTSPPPEISPEVPPPTGQPEVPPVTQLINNVGDALDTATQVIIENIITPVIDVVTSTCVGPLGTVSCGSAAAATTAVAVAITATVVQNEVAAASFSMFQVVGLRRRAKVWGVVYDSKTKKPIPLAKIELLDAAGRVLETRFADRDGRYGFLTSPSSLHASELRVQVRVQKSGYQFPSTFSITGTDYVVYDNIYRGGEVVLRGDSLVKFNIPMDPVVHARTSWSGFGQGLIGTLGDRILSLGFYIGLVTVPVNLWFAPTMKNFIIGGVFILANGIRMLALYRPYGVTFDAMTKKRLAFALVTLNDLAGNRLGFAVSDEHGRFILSGEQGKDYEITAYTPANIIPQRTTRQRVQGVKRFWTRSWITADLRI